ncbi:MAG: F0F1 ATP synthase subunit delta [Rhodospirillaceae bacterium]|nr:F0F1 ATP synthase subunit delta [Rhodospirillaceae bacterium]MBT6136366.1 F0F1 ATP synthase subunit delta [Rhodospirillaceae bacterium]
MASQTTGLAGRYASALYALADQQSALDDVAGDLTALRQLLAESADLDRLVRSPVLGRDEQAKGIAAVMDKAKAHALTAKFIGTVAMNRRLFALKDMIDAFLAELARRRGEASAEVTTAVKLTDKEVEAVTESLRKVMGQKVAVNLSVDPAVIGGMIVRVGSRMIDSSIRTKLQRLRLAMKGVG